MKKLRIITLLALVLALLFTLCACGGEGSGGDSDNDDNNKDPAVVDPTEQPVTPLLAELPGLDVQILELASYSGPYIEDGSDALVEGVLQLKVKNAGSSDFKVLFIRLTDGKGNEFVFDLSTVLSGETTVVLEKNRALYKDLKGEPESFEFSAENVALFDEKPSVHAETLAFLVMGNKLQIMNSGANDLTNVCVYYKNYADDVAQGGITYRVVIPELAAGTTAEVSTAHYRTGASRFLFATYE
ncbi:MAG: hypothetical protein HUJ66_00780 [Oscillospiraceae bacterium]|nr:hypothetical protein [Oscillospiraceae bacterium]